MTLTLETDKVNYENLLEIDRWALLRLEQVREKVTNAYEEYEFHLIYHTVHNFCTVDLKFHLFGYFKRSSIYGCAYFC